MGDFNALPKSSVIQSMRSALIDSDPTSNPTAFLYPADCCNIQSVEIRLDYIFVTRDIKVYDFKVLNSKASDHLPISLQIEI